jgi:SAM-dependent MidA family methyltransferase
MEHFRQKGVVTILAEKIRTRILERGPISFRDFMEIALYDPEQGYYTGGPPIGPQGDYYTSANIHPLFGELLAKKFASLWKAIGDPTGQTIVEVGAGTGQLSDDLLRRWQSHHPDVFQELTYVISELSLWFRIRQQERLREFSNVQWKPMTEIERESMSGIIFSNELIDALPVHRLIEQNGRLKELFVDWLGDRFGWVTGELSTEELSRLVSSMEATLEDGHIIEVNLSAAEYLRSAAAVLRQGYVVTIDYGEERLRLYSTARREGTLRCFYKHALTDDPFERIGEQDITASVDFTLLMEEGERIGLETVEFKSQRAFLMDQGLMERLTDAACDAPDGLAQLASRLAAKHFLMPGAWGDHFKLLIQRKSYD